MPFEARLFDSLLESMAKAGLMVKLMSEMRGLDEPCSELDKMYRLTDATRRFQDAFLVTWRTSKTPPSTWAMRERFYQ